MFGNLFSAVKTALLIFQFIGAILPVIDQLIHTAEATFNVPKAGADKLTFVLSQIETVYNGLQEFAGVVPWAKVVSFLTPVINTRVALSVKGNAPKLGLPEPVASAPQ